MLLQLLLLLLLLMLLLLLLLMLLLLLLLLLLLPPLVLPWPPLCKAILCTHPAELHRTAIAPQTTALAGASGESFARTLG